MILISSKAGNIGAIIGGVLAIAILLLGSITCAVILIIMKFVTKKGNYCNWWIIKKFSSYLIIISIGSTKSGRQGTHLRYNNNNNQEYIECILCITNIHSSS